MEGNVGGQPLTSQRECAKNLVFAEGIEGRDGDGGNRNGVADGIEDLDGVSLCAVRGDVVVHQAAGARGQVLAEPCETVQVLTTGGTGPARRDVTPEATLAVATRVMPGFGEQMRRISLEFVPTAILSRQVGVLRETGDHAALILNLPGQPKAITETLEGLKSPAGESYVHGVFSAVPYCIDLIGGPYVETHDTVVRSFRPKSALRIGA